MFYSFRDINYKGKQHLGHLPRELQSRVSSVCFDGPSSPMKFLTQTVELFKSCKLGPRYANDTILCSLPASDVEWYHGLLDVFNESEPDPDHIDAYTEYWEFFCKKFIQRYSRYLSPEFPPLLPVTPGPIPTLAGLSAHINAVPFVPNPVQAGTSNPTVDLGCRNAPKTTEHPVSPKSPTPTGNNHSIPKPKSNPTRPLPLCYYDSLDSRAPNRKIACNFCGSFTHKWRYCKAYSIRVRNPNTRHRNRRPRQIHNLGNPRSNMHKRRSEPIHDSTNAYSPCPIQIKPPQFERSYAHVTKTTNPIPVLCSLTLKQ